MATPKENITLAKSLYELFNQRKVDEAAKNLTSNATWTNTSTGETFQGQSGFKTFCQGWITAFSDARADIQIQFASDTHVVTEFIGRGTHDGPLKSPQGSIPPTKKKINVKFCEILQITNGKVSEGRLYFDTATMMRQLGLSPESIGTR